MVPVVAYPYNRQVRKDATGNSRKRTGRKVRDYGQLQKRMPELKLLHKHFRMLVAVLSYLANISGLVPIPCTYFLGLPTPGIQSILVIGDNDRNFYKELAS